MSHAARMPVAFIPHGGGPWPFVETGFPKEELADLAAYLRSVPSLTPVEPSGLLVISGHWERPLPTVTAAAAPRLYCDYSGFPPEAYTITWPAPGSPALASRVRALLEVAGFGSAADAERGFDHGTFIPLKVAYPEPRIPTVQLSLVAGLDPGRHLAMGAALSPLRDEGVFIIGSGMTFHNLRAFFGGTGGRQEADAFDAWLRDAMAQTASERNARLAKWSDAPGARIAHPREEHLLPLMVAAGAAGDDRAALAYTGTLAGLRHSAFHFVSPTTGTADPI